MNSSSLYCDSELKLQKTRLTERREGRRTCYRCRYSCVHRWLPRSERLNILEYHWSKHFEEWCWLAENAAIQLMVRKGLWLVDTLNTVKVDLNLAFQATRRPTQQNVCLLQPQSFCWLNISGGPPCWAAQFNQNKQILMALAYFRANIYWNHSLCRRANCFAILNTKHINLTLLALYLIITESHSIPPPMT